MTTTCVFNKDGKLINIGEWDYQEESDSNGNMVQKNPLPQGAYTESVDVVMLPDGGLGLASDLLSAAEQFVSGHFTTMQLLQLKMWADTLPLEDLPKLSSSIQWVASVGKAASGGNANFPAPPHLFPEIAAECFAIL